MGRRGQGGGGGGGSRGDNARDLKMYLKHSMWREHSYALIAVGVIVVAFFGGALLQFSTSKEHVYRLEVTNAPLLERVFRSGEPWVVLCAKPDDVVPDVFGKVSKRLVDKSFVGVLDCTQKLPSSGKSVLKRYGIKASVSPTVFTVANGEKPKQIFLDHLQSSKALAKRVVAQTKKSAKEILNSAQLEIHCLQKPTCVLFLRGQKYTPYEKQWLDKLLQEHRTLQFAWVDATLFKLSIESSLPQFVRGEHRMMLFRRKRDASGAKHKATIAAKAYRNIFDPIPVGMFLKEHATADDLKPLAKAPTIARRKAKAKAGTKSKSIEDGAESSTKRQASDKNSKKASKEQEEEKGDEYYFPQSAEEGDSVDSPSDALDDDVEVLDLDDE